MASREVKTSVENLRDLVENGDAGAVSLDDDAREIIGQISSAALSDAGLHDLGLIMPIFASGDQCLCSVVQAMPGNIFAGTITEVLDFLAQLLETVAGQPGLHHHVLLHVGQLWMTTSAVCKSAPGARPRAAAIKVMGQVLRFAADTDQLNDLNLSETLKFFIDEIRRNVKKMPQTVKQPLYGFLGDVAHRAPLLVDEYADSLLGIFTGELQTEMKSKDPKFAVISGSLDGVSGMMYSFSGAPLLTQKRKEIFGYCTKVIHVKEVARYAMILSALTLISKHAGKFTAEFLERKSGYTELYSDLTEWATHGNRDAHKLGYSALDSFLREVSRSIVYHVKQGTHLETSRAAFNFFIAEFSEKIRNAVTTRELALAVRGYGYFTAPAVLLASADDVNQMFTEMIYKSEQMFFSTSPEGVEDKLTNLPSFVETLAGMVHDGGMGLPDIFQQALQRLCILLMEVFPRLGPPQQHFGAKALVKMFLVISRASVAAGDLFSEIVYQGLVRSCSYPVPEEPVDEEIPAYKKPVTYKDFLHLWEKLVGCEYMKDVLKEVDASEIELYNTGKLIFDEMMSSSVRIIGSLNLALLSTVPEDEALTADIMSVDKTPGKEQDFQIFFSLEQIITNTVSKVKSDVGSTWSTKFVDKIVVLSTKHPLLAGLYRLISVWWRFDRRANVKMVVEESDSQEDIDMENGVSLPDRLSDTFAVTAFVRELMGKIQHFWDEVLVSALLLLLDSPVYALIENIHLLAQPLLLALQTGKSDLPLADAVVSALDRWCVLKEIPLKLLEPLFPVVLPHLDSFLCGTTVDLVERSRVAEGPKRRRKAKRVITSEEAALNQVREKIIGFLGSLGAKYNRFLLGSDRVEDIRNHAISWDMEQHLKLALPFTDIALNDFFLDDLLPRVSDLCLHSPDRATKVAACECLHALTISVIGSHADLAGKGREKGTLVNLLRKLMPKLLELACDLEPVTKQIFEPLVLQMVHWYARKAEKASDESTVILDCIMEGLVNERNPVVKGFAASCVREYLEWSFKDVKRDKLSVAAEALFIRIINFAGHSSSTKRFGAGLAFTRCYRLFRENFPLVNAFALELVVIFVKSLAMAHRDPPGSETAKIAEDCLEHLGRIVEKLTKELKKNSPNKRIPAELAEASPVALMDWLFLQSCRPESKCRVKCWSLLERFAKAVPEYRSAADYISNTEKNRGTSWLLKCFLNGGQDPEVVSSLLPNKLFEETSFKTDASALHLLDRFGAAVDAFARSLGDAYIKPEKIAELEEWTLFANLVKQFLDFAPTFGVERSTTGLTSDIALHQTVCTILVRVTDLVGFVLHKFGKPGLKLMPHVILSPELARVLALMTLEPDALGFDLTDTTVKSGLLQQMRGFFAIVLKGIEEKHLKILRTAFRDQMASPKRDLGTGTLVLNQFLVSAFGVVHQLGLDHEYLHAKKLTASGLATKLLDHVSKSLGTKFVGFRKASWITVNVDQERLAFQLALYFEPKLAGVMDEFFFAESERSKYYSKLKRPFFKFVFDAQLDGTKVQRAFLDVLFEKGSWIIVNETLKDTLEYAVAHRSVRKKYGEKFVEELMRRYGPFLHEKLPKKASKDDHHTPLDVLKLCLLVHPTALKAASAETSGICDFYAKVLFLPTLNDQTIVSLKNDGLKLLAYFLDGAGAAKAEEALQHLYVSDFPVNAAELTKDSIQSAYYLQAVELILGAVSMCGNRTALEICVKLVCRDKDHPLMDRFHKLFETICQAEQGDNAQKILEVPWKISVNKQYDIEHREVAVDKILSPMLRSVSLSVLSDFFAKHLEEIVDIVEKKQRVATKDHLVSQKCCFELLEIYCAATPKTDLLSPTASVTVALHRMRSGGNPTDKPSGKEFMAFVTRSADAASHENVPLEPGLEEIRRHLHCAAYRALVAAITATQADMKFYLAFLFEEKSDKGKILWTNLVDVERTYQFPVEFVQAPRKKLRLAAIHKELSNDSNGALSSLSSGIFTMTSYASARASAATLIQGSSLGDELGRFDFSNGLDRTTTPLSIMEKAAKAEVTLSAAVTLEMDDLNFHECMPTFVALIGHMVTKNITPAGGQLPGWVASLKQALQNPATPLNVKLFIAKLMVNVENSEQPYFENFADHLYVPIAELALSIECPEGLNYFVVDLVQMLLKWSVKKPPQRMDQSRLQDVLVFVMKNVRHTNSLVQRNNLTLLKVMAEAWRDHLHPPGNSLITNLLTNDPAKAKSNLVVINIIAIMLEARLPFTSAAFDEYQKILFLHLKTTSKPVYTVSSLTLGLVVSRAVEVKLDSDRVENLIRDIEDRLTELQNKDKDQFLAVLHQLQKSYPQIAHGYLSPILFLAPKLSGDLKAKCLEIVIACSTTFDDPYKEFQTQGLKGSLADRNENVQGLAVQFFTSILARMSTEDCRDLLPDLADILYHRSPLLRQQAYDLCMRIYERFETSGTAAEKGVLQTARRYLFTGLKDRDKTIRQNLTVFWSQEKRFSGTTFQRLVAIFDNLLDPDLESTFSSVCCHLLLDLCQKSPRFAQPVFDQALADCEFFKQEIETQWRQRSTLAPVTAGSYATGTFSGSYGSARLGQRAPVFTPTQMPTASTQDTLANSGMFTYASQFSESLMVDLPRRDWFAGMGGGDASSQLSQADKDQMEHDRTQKDLDSLRRRFQRVNQARSSVYFAQREMSKQNAREEQLKREREKRNLDVKMSRMYRIGEVPDVQITFSAYIQPLQNLCERDNQTAGLLLTRLFRGIVIESRKTIPNVDAELIRLAKHMEKVLLSENVSDVLFVGTMLNLVATEEARLLESVSANCVTTAATKSQQPHLGIALLEASLLRQTAEPPPKRGQAKASKAPENWLGLYGLLESIGETDSVRGLKLEGVFYNADKVGDAVDAETRGDFNSAATVYADLYEDSNESEPASRLLRESYMRCLVELGKWDTLEEVAIPQSSSQQDGMEILWEHPGWADLLMPYAIRSKLKIALENLANSAETLGSFFNAALQQPSRNAIMERKYPYELALLCLRQDKRSEAEYYLKAAVKSLLDDWAGTSPINYHSRSKHLPKMQLVEEAKRYAAILAQSMLSPDRENGFKQGLLSFLLDEQREPDVMNDVAVWSDLVTNRCFFAKKLEHGMKRDLVGSFVVQEKLKVASAALEHHNFRMSDQLLVSTRDLARSNFPDSQYYASEDSLLPRLHDRWNVTYINGAIERARWYTSSSEAETSAKKLFGSLDLVRKLIPKAATPNQPVLKVVESQILEGIADILSAHSDVVKLDPAQTKSFGSSNGNLDFSRFHQDLLKTVDSACSSLPDSASSADALLHEFGYCDKILGKKYVPDSELVELGSKTLLRAMKLGSPVARDLFCRLLVWLTEFPEIIPLFQENCAEIPSWMFLSWSSQMLALFDKEEGVAVHSILLRLAEEYPQAMIYPFRISKEGYVFDETENGKSGAKMCHLVGKKLEIPLVNEFIQQLEFLTAPQLYFVDFNKRAERLLKEKKNDQLKREFEELYGKVFKEDALTSLNPTWKHFVKDSRDKILTLFGTEGKKIPKLKYTQFRSDNQKLEKVLKDYAVANQKQQPTQPKTLSEANQWLAKFDALNYQQDLEIPGQYTGREKPDPERHVRIMSFGEDILHLQSIRHPVRLNVRGNDEKDYPVLVKSGEDLRLDQRVEQLFLLMNRIFEQDSECWKRSLKIKTYQVVPMTTTLGLIEWVPNTVTIKSFLCKGQKETPAQLNAALGGFREELYRFFKKKLDAPAKEVYQPSYTRMSSAEIQAMFRRAEQKIDPYLLRSQLEKLTVSLEAFIMVRNIFAETYAAFSIGQFVLGIGDRHLSNYLISTETATVFPIDFGHAFGSTVQFLPVPELIPIRLTRQFVNVMAPLSVSGKMKQTMIHALRALRKEQQILLATMDVFVQEPSVDWLQNARKSTPIDESPEGDLRWYPREKIATAQRKLQGGNPSFITRDELHRSTLFPKDVLAKMEEACVRPHSYRASQPENDLTVETQVDCLIDQATDADLLARVFFGWDPWI